MDKFLISLFEDTEPDEIDDPDFASEIAAEVKPRERDTPAPTPEVMHTALFWERWWWCMRYTETLTHADVFAARERVELAADALGLITTAAREAVSLMHALLCTASEDLEPHFQSRVRRLWEAIKVEMVDGLPGSLPADGSFLMACATAVGRVNDRQGRPCDVARADQRAVMELQTRLTRQAARRSA